MIKLTNKWPNDQWHNLSFKVKFLDYRNFNENIIRIRSFLTFSQLHEIQNKCILRWVLWQKPITLPPDPLKYSPVASAALIVNLYRIKIKTILSEFLKYFYFKHKMLKTIFSTPLWIYEWLLVDLRFSTNKLCLKFLSCPSQFKIKLQI